MAKEAAILHGVQKHYKDFTLGPIDLTVPTGTIVGLVGENGAGKTTHPENSVRGESRRRRHGLDAGQQPHRSGCPGPLGCGI